MMENQDKRTSVMRITILSLFVLLLAAIALFYVLFIKKEPANITNYDQEKELFETRLTSDEIDSLKTTVRNVASLNYGYNGKIDISVRWSSFIRDSALKIYLIDVDSIKQTFEIRQADKFIDVFCPSMTATKYPNSFCYRYGDTSDSLDMVFGGSLPYLGKTASGIEYTIRNVSDSDRQLLTVFVKKANASEADLNEALDSAKAYVTSLGAGKDLFRFETELESMNGMGE